MAKAMLAGLHQDDPESDGLASASLSWINSNALQMRDMAQSVGLDQMTHLVGAILREIQVLELASIEQKLRRREASRSSQVVDDLSRNDKAEADDRSLVERSLKLAFDSMERSKFESSRAVDEALELQALIRQNNADLRASQTETRALIEQLLNG